MPRASRAVMSKMDESELRAAASTGDFERVRELVINGIGRLSIFKNF